MKKRNAKNNVFAVAAVAVFAMTGCQSDAGSAETEALKEQIARLEQQISDLEQQQSAAGNNTAQGADLSTAGSDNGLQAGADAYSENSQQPQNDTSVGNSQESQNDTSVGNSQESQNDTSVGDSRQPQNDTSVGNGQESQNGTTAGNNGNVHSPGHDEGEYHNQSHYTRDSSATEQQESSVDELTTYTMDELSVMVDAFVAKAVAAEPSGQTAQDMEQFFALKQEEKQIDDALDRHEDELEYLYKKGSLTRDEYKQLDHKLELLEDQLNDIEDQLEYVFGIED